MCRLPLARPQLGTWPVTQARAPTGNETSDLLDLACRMALIPLSHTSQGTFKIFLMRGCPLKYWRSWGRKTHLVSTHTKEPYPYCPTLCSPGLGHTPPLALEKLAGMLIPSSDLVFSPRGLCSWYCPRYHCISFALRHGTHQTWQHSHWCACPVTASPTWLWVPRGQGNWVCFICIQRLGPSGLSVSIC